MNRCEEMSKAPEGSNGGFTEVTMDKIATTERHVDFTTFKEREIAKGTRRRMTWPKFVEMFEHGKETKKAKDALPQWTAAVFVGDQRRSRKFLAADVVVLDYDNKEKLQDKTERPLPVERRIHPEQP